MISVKPESEAVEHCVFLSCSHRDASLVRALSSLLRAGGAPVWSDNFIDYGDSWRVTIVTSIESCERLILFWCRHSAKSVEVRREYELALSARKPGDLRESRPCGLDRGRDRLRAHRLGAHRRPGKERWS
jgi:hypothetical protein